MAPDKPPAKTDVYLILQESALYPPEMHYEYVAGMLRNDLQKRTFGSALTYAGYKRAKNLAEKLRDRGIIEIITDESTTSLETARVIAHHGLDISQLIGDEDFIKRTLKEKGITTDPRLADGDLSHLTRGKFNESALQLPHGPSVLITDWHAQASQDEKDSLYRGYAEAWNSALARNCGKPFAFVLHAIGMQFFVNALLGRPTDRMADLHFNSGTYIHAQIFPEGNARLLF